MVLLVPALKDIGSCNTKPCLASSLLTTPGKEYVYWSRRWSISKCSVTIQNLAERSPVDGKDGQWGEWIAFCECRQASTYLLNCYLNCSTINYHVTENLGSLLQTFSKLSVKHFKIKNIYYSCYFHISFSLENENRSIFSLVLKQGISYSSQKSVHGKATSV